MACTIPRAFLQPQKISAVHSGSSRRGENSPRSSTTATRNMRPMLPPLSERIKSRKSVVLPEPGFPHSKKPESNFSPNTSVITRLHPGTSRAMRITIELIFPAERDSASSEREWGANAGAMPARQRKKAVFEFLFVGIYTSLAQPAQQCVHFFVAI